MRKVAGYDYPYKVWPDDYPHESLYPDSVVTEIVAKHGLSTDSKSIKAFQKMLIRAARDFFGREKFYGPNAVTDSDIFRDAGNLLSAANGLRSRLEPDKLPVEFFEVLVDAWADLHGDGSPNEVPSFYSEYGFREDSPLQIPTITRFYKDHSGYKKFNAFRERLLPLLEDLEVVAKAIVDDDSKFYYGVQKNTGESQYALNHYVTEMKLYWQEYKATTHNNSRAACGRFIADCFKHIIPHMDANDSNKKRIDELKIRHAAKISNILNQKKRPKKKSTKKRRKPRKI